MLWIAASHSRLLGLTLGCALLLPAACKKDGEGTAPPAGAEAEADDGSNEGSDDGDDESAEALSQSVFEDQVRAEMEDVLECYASASADNPELQGQVVVNFTIAGDGSVESTAIDGRSTLNDEGLNTCLQGKFSNWRFAAPASGEAMVLVFPFALSPA